MPNKLGAKMCTPVTVLGKGGAGKLLASVNSVVIPVVSGHDIVVTDVDTHGPLSLKSPGAYM